MCLWSELAIVNLKLFNVTWLHTVVDFSTFPTIRVITLDALYDVNTPWRQFVEIRSQVDNAKSMGTQQGQDGLLEMVLCFVSEINSIFFFKWKKKIKFCSSNMLCILFCWFVKLKKTYECEMSTLRNYIKVSLNIPKLYQRIFYPWFMKGYLPRIIGRYPFINHE